MDGPWGAAGVGLLALAVIGELWIVARGAPSAANDETRPSPTAMVSVGERFGREEFPTARAVVGREPLRIVPLPDRKPGPRASPAAGATAIAARSPARSAEPDDGPIGGGGRARPIPTPSAVD